MFWHATNLDGVPIVFALQPVLSLDTTKTLTGREEDLLRYLAYKEYDVCGMVSMQECLQRHAADHPDFLYVGCSSYHAAG